MDDFAAYDRRRGRGGRGQSLPLAGMLSQMMGGAQRQQPQPFGLLGGSFPRFGASPWRQGAMMRNPLAGGRSAFGGIAPQDLGALLGGQRPDIQQMNGAPMIPSVPPAVAQALYGQPASQQALMMQGPQLPDRLAALRGDRAADEDAKAGAGGNPGDMANIARYLMQLRMDQGPDPGLLQWVMNLSGGDLETPRRYD